MHITLSKVNISQSEEEILKNDIDNLMQGTKQFQVKYQDIVSVLRLPSTKYPDGHAWVSMTFQDNNLFKLFQDTNNYLTSKGWNGNEEYINNIKELEQNHSLKLTDCIANHLNLCNYAKPDMAEEAKDIIIRKAPRTFIIDSIALRKDSSHAWEISLN
ncbi:MAG: hypothetical protein M3Q44_07680 [bacterium]|nr:hypothetical protein [bacterium]